MTGRRAAREAGPFLLVVRQLHLREPARRGPRFAGPHAHQAGLPCANFSTTVWIGAPGRTERRGRHSSRCIRRGQSNVLGPWAEAEALRPTALMASARALFWTRPNSAIRRPTDCPGQSFGRLPALKLSRFSSWVTASRGLLAEPSGHEPGGPHADSEHDQDARTGLLSGRDCAYNGISTSPRPGPFREEADQRVFPKRR